MPLFSVLIPTHNRASLVTYSINSVLSQSFPDLELIVIDNCSEDNTADVVHQYKDDRLSYVKTPELLLASDNWEFALTHARGKYVAVLHDDDVMGSRLLECVAALMDHHNAEMFLASYAAYYDKSYPGSQSQRNRLVVMPYADEVRVIDPVREFIEPWINFEQRFRSHPSFTFFARTLIDRVIASTGRFYHLPGPDLSSWLLAAAYAEGVVRFSFPLGVVGRTGVSSTTNIVRSHHDQETAKRAWSWTNAELKYVPFQSVITNANFGADVMYRTLRMFPEHLASLTVNEHRYYLSLIDELRQRMQLDGVGGEFGEKLEHHLRNDPELLTMVTQVLNHGRRGTFSGMTNGLRYVNIYDMSQQDIVRRIYGDRVVDSRAWRFGIGLLGIGIVRLLRHPLTVKMWRIAHKARQTAYFPARDIKEALDLVDAQFDASVNRTIADCRELDTESSIITVGEC